MEFKKGWGNRRPCYGLWLKDYIFIIIRIACPLGIQLYTKVPIVSKIYKGL